MMKKLLIFMLVFGLTSMSFALTGIELSLAGVTNGEGNTQETTIEVCTEIVIDVHGPAAYDWLGYCIIEGEADELITDIVGGEWGDNIGPYTANNDFYYEDSGYPVVQAAAGDMADALRYVESGWGWGYELTAAQGTGDVPGGEEFRLLFHCFATGDVTITLWDDSEGYDTPQDTIIIHQVPEPMTIALLGLGGLLLRRRR
jgi:hypothetical protein